MKQEILKLALCLGGMLVVDGSMESGLEGSIGAE
jgi:hypothetical protein